MSPEHLTPRRRVRRAPQLTRRRPVRRLAQRPARRPPTARLDGRARRRLRLRLRGPLRAHASCRRSTSALAGRHRALRRGRPDARRATADRRAGRERARRAPADAADARSTWCSACRCSSTCGSPRRRSPTSTGCSPPAAPCSINVPSWRGKRFLEFPPSGSASARPRRWTTTSATTTPRTCGRCWSRPAFARARSAASATSSASTRSPSAATAPGGHR